MKGRWIFREINKIPCFSWSAVLYGNIQRSDVQILSIIHKASLIAQLVKNPPAMEETSVWFLGQEDPLEKG